ncbi:MAG TPA: DNA polymerase III subunit delta [Armatimonadota bacterium]
MNLKYTQLPKDGPLPVQGSWLLVQGGEEHLKRQLVEKLRGQLLSDDDSFNFDLVDVTERWDGVAETSEQAKRDRQPTRADRILSLAQALPFLGSGRLVMVRNIDLLPNDQQKKLAAAFASVPPMNHLLLITGEAETGKKPAKLAADLLKGVTAHGTVYDCSALSDEEAAQWVRDALTTWGQRIDPAALRLLLTRTGTELRRVQIEVDKLSLMVGEGGVIRLQDVELMTPKLAEESVFHLVDAVAARDAAHTLAVLRDLLEGQMESPFRIFPMIVRQFRLIWQTKVLLDAGWRPKQDPSGFPNALAILPEQHALALIGGWMGSKLAGPARQMSWGQLTQAYQALLECDMASKAIEGVPRQEMEIAMEMLCVKLCMPLNANAR